MTGSAARVRLPWEERLTIPNYRVNEAARYANVSPQTVAAWQSRIGGFLPSRSDRDSLSYLQLIEVAVVAAFRKAGIKLSVIREARAFAQSKFRSEYPFADYKFKQNGKGLVVDYAQIDKRAGKGKLLELNKAGQLTWELIVQQRLREFEYDKHLVLRWHVAGAGSKIVIDPRLSFGAPTIRGTPVWAIRGRWDAGEQINEIASDFGLSKAHVVEALQFDGINVGPKLGGRTSPIL